MGLLLDPGPSRSPKSADASVWTAGGNPSKYPRKLSTESSATERKRCTLLVLTVCVKDPARQRGFYLITLKGSKQAGLTGLKGGIVRKVAVGKARSSLERTLVSIKEKLETETN